MCSTISGMTRAGVEKEFPSKVLGIVLTLVAERTWFSGPFSVARSWP